MLTFGQSSAWHWLLLRERFRILSSSEFPTRSVQELHQNAAEFLNGSDGFYFWTHVLEQDPEWLLRRLHAQLLSRPRTELRRNVRRFPHRQRTMPA